MKFNFKQFLLLIILSFSVKSFTQEYNFINYVFEDYKSDTIYVEDKFIVQGKQLLDAKYFNKVNFQEWWYPIPSSNNPSINFFLIILI